MWDGLFTLLGLSIVMALGSFLAGSVPLSFTLSPSHNRLIQCVGTGVLVGTSLVVIIPEGIETLYGASSPEVTHALQPEATQHFGGRDPHAWVGISLILGFILMFLIDQLPQLASSHMHGPQQPMHISLSSLGLGRTPSPSSDAQQSFLEAQPAAPKGRHFATTIGLVIHAAADGIALGASSSMTTSNLGFIIFLAIMVHKAPAAFGLTSVLLKEGLTRRMARAHLTIFSLAAPLGAFATWMIVNLLGRDWLGGDDGTAFATGVLLLFSGGTFLYVAMHTMQESGSAEPEGGVNGSANGNVYGESYAAAPKTHGTSGIRDLLAAVVGMLLPLLTQLGHAH